MRIRPAEVSDAEAICSITNPIISDTLVTFTSQLRTPDAVSAEIAERKDAFLIAELEQKVVGFASFGPFRPGPGYAHSREHSIQLAPNARGLGFGQALMRELERMARRQQVHVLVAGISSANPSAIKFHGALGFQQVGRLPEVGFKQGRWLDLILMQKLLTLGPDGTPDTGDVSR